MTFDQQVERIGSLISDPETPDPTPEVDEDAAAPEASCQRIKATSMPHGMSAAERRRLGAAMHALQQETLRLQALRRGTCALHITLGDALLDLEPGEARREVDKVQSRLADLQRRAGYPVLWLKIWEGEPGLHAHFVVIGSRKMGQRLMEAFPDYMRTPKAVRAVTDWRWGEYFLKHAASQGTFGTQFKRQKGAHHLPGGVADRVRLSRALTDIANVEPFKGTNARRVSPEHDRRKHYSGRRPKPAPVPGTLPLDIEPMLFVTRPPARLRLFQGGLVPPAVAVEIQHLRRLRDLTLEELASRAHVSRPQLTNALVGRYPLSDWVAARLRDELLAA